MENLENINKDNWLTEETQNSENLSETVIIPTESTLEKADNKKKKERRFTKGEEIFNGVTHIVGAGFAILATLAILVVSGISGDVVAILSAVIYGFSLIVLYVMSSVYHMLRFNRAKKVFRVLDHCSIFLLIAGTYTPFCLITLRGNVIGIVLFCIVWAIAILGIVLNAIDLKNKAIVIFSQISYVVLGWCVVIGFKPIMDAMSFWSLLWLIAGGVAYTVGIVFFALGRRVKYFHPIWHFFVMFGSAFQYISVFIIMLNLIK